jgi:hypothetical protein
MGSASLVDPSDSICMVASWLVRLHVDLHGIADPAERLGFGRILNEPLFDQANPGNLVIARLFLGLLCWALTVVPLYRWLLGDKYDAYSRWYSRWHGQQFGFDGNSKKLLVGLVGLFLGFPAFMIVFGSNWHLRVEENSIGWKRFLSFTEKQYSYDEIDKIVETSHARAPMGNVGECARIFLVFSDGNKWSFEDMGYSYARGEYDREMIQYIQNRSGKPLIHATFIEDVAP